MKNKINFTYQIGIYEKNWGELYIKFLSYRSSDKLLKILQLTDEDMYEISKIDRKYEQDIFKSLLND